MKAADFLISKRCFAVFTLVLITTPVWGEPDIALRAPIIVIQSDPHHRGTLLAGTATARLFRSRDQGDSWSRMPFPAESRSILHAIRIDPVRPNVYWVALSSEAPQFAGAFRSLDEGVTWERVRGLEQKQVWAFAFWKADTRVIAAGTEDGVYLTRDGGEDWKFLSVAGAARPSPVVSLAFDPADANILYAGTPHLVWKTVNGGSTWHPIPRGMQEDSDIFSLAVDARLRTRLFAGACSGIYRSSDGGRTWSSLERYMGGQVRTYVLAWAPSHPDTIYAGTSLGLIVSKDNGATWYRLSAEAARAVAFDPTDPRRIFVATDNGVLRIEDGGTPVCFTGAAAEEHSQRSASGCSGRY